MFRPAAAREDDGDGKLYTTASKRGSVEMQEHKRVK
jgi:hypothetical protein